MARYGIELIEVYNLTNKMKTQFKNVSSPHTQINGGVFSIIYILLRKNIQLTFNFGFPDLQPICITIQTMNDVNQEDFCYDNYYFGNEKELDKAMSKAKIFANIYNKTN